MPDKIQFDILGYAKYKGMWIGKQEYPEHETVYWISEGDHPHDPDGISQVVPGPRPTSLEEVIKLANMIRATMLTKKLSELNS